MGFVGTSIPAGSVWPLPIQHRSLSATKKLRIDFATARSNYNSRLILQRRQEADIVLCQFGTYTADDRIGFCQLNMEFYHEDLPSAPALKAEGSDFDIVGHTFLDSIS